MIETLTGVRSRALGNSRDVFVYLPPGHDPAAGPYPVVILQDGQHVFAAAGLSPSWRVDETLDDLIGRGLLPPLVAVGVSNAGDQRGNEYSHVAPYPRDPNGVRKGELYEEFLVEELLPELRERYAVTADPAATAVMGSSMGGLVSYHLAFRRPEVFGLVAALSPFLVFVDPRTLEETPVYRRFDARGPRRVWLDIGGMEGLIMVRPVRELAEHLLDLGYAPDDELRYLHEPSAPHHEDAWAARAGSALLHLFGTAGPPVLLSGTGGETATGQDLDVAPIAERADGCVYSALGARVTWQPAGPLKSVGHALLEGVEAGAAQVVARTGELEVSERVTVVDGAADALLDVTVVVPLDTPGDSPVYFSGLVTTKVAPGVHHGVWRLPRGVGLNGAVGRGWRCDGLDTDGFPIRTPLRHDADRRVWVRVASWSDPAQNDPHAGS
ncbi:alpha/beta hydrolase [Nonomuraea endophytica]|uniref:Enterochelin esterase-like enzyme n=1 Tax=Nonomuraea endophytica TaxID=714136 RepID=A0A7W8EHC9_9ACTN|nr:alpha/beta hydrolase-fold protein [Nonomuraea endophytica]MBB5079418.1 enterochelin esterase-like enzyme [Nonomuraea endophytica]